MSTDSLCELQTRFHAHILRGDESMLAHISTDAGADAATRLAIYGKGYRLRLLEALAADFPALHTLAGDVLFEQLGRAYIDAHPSTHFSIRWFGRSLADFLRTTEPFRATPVLGEMAALEWALSLAFDAADETALAESAFMTLPAESWPDMQLRFHPSVQRRDFSWNVPELWRAIDRQEQPIPPERYGEPRPWLIWRSELQNRFRALDANEARAIDSLSGGARFGEMCAELAGYIDPAQAGLQAATWLKGWAIAGLITRSDV